MRANPNALPSPLSSESSADPGKEGTMNSSSIVYRTSDPHGPSFDAERPFIDLLKGALDLPAAKRPAFIRAHCDDLSMSDIALECLDAMNELG